MKTRKIGRTDVQVTEVSFGTASTGNLYREVSDEDAQAATGQVAKFKRRFDFLSATPTAAKK